MFRRYDEWKPRRKLLTPTFHYDILKNFVHIFNSQSEIMVNLMLEKFEEGAEPGQKLER